MAKLPERWGSATVESGAGWIACPTPLSDAGGADGLRTGFILAARRAAPPFSGNLGHPGWRPAASAATAPGQPFQA